MKNRILSMVSADSDVLKDFSLLFLRLSLSATLFFAHGLPKVIHFSEKVGSFPDPLGVGSMPSLVLTIFAEVNCSVLVFFGLFTRLASFPLVITFLMIWLVIHGGSSFDRQELPVLFLIGFTTLLIAGSGRFSLDRILFR